MKDRDRKENMRKIQGRNKLEAEIVLTYYSIFFL